MSHAYSSLWRNNRISRNIIGGLILCIAALISFSIFFQSTLRSVKKESDSTIGTFIPLSVTSKSLRSDTSDAFSTLNLEYHTNQKAENFEIQALMHGISQSKEKLQQLSESYDFSQEALAHQQLKTVIANTEEFMQAAGRLRQSKANSSDSDFNSKFYPLYVEISEIILANDNLRPELQKLVSDLSYQLAYCHLLITEAGSTEETTTYTEVLNALAKSTAILERLEHDLKGGPTAVSHLRELTQIIDSKYQGFLQHEAERQTAYNDFTNAYAAFHLNTLAVESYLDSLLVSHEDNLVTYISKAERLTSILLVCSAAVGATIYLLFHRTVLRPFLELMNDTQIYLKTGNIQATPGRNRKDEVGTLARVVDDLKKADTEKAQVMQSLKDATGEAQKANQAKSQFLANMSHEIRTPLNSIIGFTDILQSEDLNLEQQNMANTIKSSSNTLLALVNDILDLAKIESNELTIESIPSNLEEIVYEVAETQISSSSKDKLVELNIDNQLASPHISTDPTRLKQVLMNLISNAKKFTEKGEILVSLKSTYQDDITQTIEFSVNDTGIGMTKEQAFTIFDAFKQADGSTTRKYGGSGLGLNISQKLVQALGGNIEVQSAPGKGSRFSFELSFKKCYASSAIDASKWDLSTLKKKHFLIVDDNDSARKIMQRYFNDEGLSCHAAASADEAMVILNQHQIHIVLTDIVMPGKDGYSLFSDAKKLDPELSFIAVTSDMRSNTVNKLKALGFDGYIFKPIRKKSLITSLLATLSSPPVTQVATVPSSNEVNSQVHILLVDDNKTNIMVGKVILTRMGHTVTAVTSGQEAINKIESESFDLVLMDMQMPEMSGVEATIEIRKLGHTLPIVALTANAFESDKKVCLEAGMNDYMTKPVDKDKLSEKISLHIDKDTNSKLG